MKITLIQPELQWRNHLANIQAVERLMSQSPGSDLYVLPEMWATGFDVLPNALTREGARKALAWMKRQADDRQCAVAGSLAVDESVEDGEEHAVAGWKNRFYFVMPGGQLEYYDKVHLFTVGDEVLSFVPGTRDVAVSWRGVRFRLQVCFDLRFPESARQSVGQPYDVLLNVANWPSSRQVARDVLLRARAIENQTIVVGVNCAGCCGKQVYPGRSVALDAEGQTIVQASDQADAVTFEPDVSAVHRLRAVFPVGFEPVW